MIGPYLNERKAAFDPATGIRPPSGRSVEARLDEAAGLARAIDLDVVAAEIAMLSKLKPATYLGTGKVEEFAALVKEKDVEIVIVDCALSPVQQRNLEKEFVAKVIDRTGLILEIFGRRARTREGALQVELAHLAYQRSRLVRSWTHLERQRGGFGFLGGPGETQIEADRRLIQERILKIERDLEGVKKTRGLHRAQRQAVPYPVVALVGYTNAGKSTLFNRLTRAEVLAQDMLFATLDPTLRAVALPHGERIMLSDTVGFISDLPTQLVTAFRATLEEVIEADLVLHVRDLSHEDTEAQSTDVEQVLRDLGIDPNDGHFVEIWNKIDLLDPSQADALRTSVSRRPLEERPFVVSALTGEGIDDLLAGIEARLSRDHVTFELRLGPQEQDQLGWIYDNMQVLSRDHDEDGAVHFKLRVAPDMIDRLERRMPQATRVVVRQPARRRPRRPAAE
ncbi:GTPase HflX [Beijerinckia sp. 28-YEA-48]|uniref:GTPase HflX n=1 Tax=unclassified Beijerinckia TaxID=2638183 RepID=UPI00089779D2|nr:GTP-binding protein HflX [Beijerinckia sp. GAS462]SEB84765.1 GTP-binding protein HflX [Beijerinckia sp. 28-YEA-48]